MLDPFGVGLCRLGRHAERAEQVDDEPVADAHAVGQRLSLLGEEDPRYGRAVAKPARLRREIVFTAVAWETPSRRAMSVGRASPSPASRSAISSA